MAILLLWDIDGTLLSTGRAGIFAWEDAVKEVVGKGVDLGAFPTAGMTDPEIAAKLNVVFGDAARPELGPRMLALYERYLPASLPKRQGEVLPNVVPVLAYLSSRGDVKSLLLTGNTRLGASAKLKHYGLEHFFAKGAFSDGCPDRPSIARAALSLAFELHGEHPLEQVYVIGDTPHDVSCAAAIGARCIAVATGPYSHDDLAKLKPWRTFKTLPEPARFLAEITGESH